MRRLPLTVLSITALLAVVAAGAVWRMGAAPSQSETATPAAAPSETATTETAANDEFGGAFSLIDQDGKRRTEMDFRGKYMLIFFGFTYCPDFCPTSLAVQAEALDQLGEQASRIVPIFITVDPKRDTPEKLKSYLSAFDAKSPSPRSNFVGLTGSDEEIAAVAKGYNVYYRAHLDTFHTTGPENYTIDHSSDAYLMSPEGKFISYYSIGISPDELAADLKQKAL
jgi:protein SCO1/2